jgi:hypothetical protein
LQAIIDRNAGIAVWLMKPASSVDCGQTEFESTVGYSECGRHLAEKAKAFLGIACLRTVDPAAPGKLRFIAARRLRGERSNHTPQATALVHETYLKLPGAKPAQLVDRVRFLALASRVSPWPGADVVSPLWKASLWAKGESRTGLLDLIEMLVLRGHDRRGDRAGHGDVRPCASP